MALSHLSPSMDLPHKPQGVLGKVWYYISWTLSSHISTNPSTPTLAYIFHTNNQHNSISLISAATDFLYLINPSVHDPLQWN